MILDFLYYFFLRKAKKHHIKKILEKENFVYTHQDIESILKGNQKGVRYGNMVLLRRENGQECKRFLKIVIDGTVRTFKLFRRQVEISNALNKDTKYKSPSMKVIVYSFKGTTPYAIFETRENGNDYGFMHDNQSFYEKFLDRDMENLVNAIYYFHNAGLNINKEIYRYTQNITSRIFKHKKDIKKLLNTIITHKSKDEIIDQKSVREVLETYLGFKNLDKIVFGILEKNWKNVIESKITKGNLLVHADMQIDNIYKHKDGNFELLDFEWVGQTDSPVIAIMYDYGNLRARAWSSPSFQRILDKKMFEIGKKYYKNEIVESGLVLGKLRSSLMMCRYHLDFVNTVKKDKRTEEDYQNMYKKTVESFKEVLNIGVSHYL